MTIIHIPEQSTVHNISVVHGGSPRNYRNDFWIVKLLEKGMGMERGMEVGREMGSEMGTQFPGDDSRSGDCSTVGLVVLR